MKLLLATNRMTLGGAETHLLALIRALRARGHDVTLASAGGELCRECGVRQVILPLNSARPTDAARAFLGLTALAARERFDLIHAHARIPAAICGAVARLAGIPMVTTAHGCFRVDPLLGRLSDWGDGVLAVSCTVKDYLMREYGLPEEAIALTVNGIDAELFSPVPRPTAHRERVLLHVSRLDRGSDGAARALIRLAPHLRARFPSLRILIVGGGETEAQLRRMAAGVRGLEMLGAREDVPELLRRADLFVGVSRAALEAMSCALPVVLEGDGGQMGLFRPEMEEDCAENNFCCHGHAGSDARLLASLTEALGMPEPLLRQMGEENRRIIRRRYSVERMADDAEALYQRVRARRGERVMIGGYYGCGNCGDEAILQGLLCDLHRTSPDARITVLSAAPRRTSLQTGVRCLHRLDPAIAAEMARTDRFLLGGGSLLTDRTSRRSLGYYTALLALAHRMGCRTEIVSAGIGPLSDHRARDAVRNSLAIADSVSCRDNRSCALAMSLAPRAEIARVRDPAFHLPPPDPLWARYRLRTLGVTGGRWLGVAIRPIEHAPRRLEDALVRLIASLCRKHRLRPLFFIMHDPIDQRIAARLADRLRKLSPLCLPPLSPCDTEAALGTCRLVLAMRLHAAILAHKAGVPMLGISYDPKTEAFFEENGVRFVRL